MYVARRLYELKNVSLSDWTMEELAYFQSTFNALEDYIGDEGNDMLRQINTEIQNRGGFPDYQGEYDRPSHILFD